jgi:surface antigen
MYYKRRKFNFIKTMFIAVIMVLILGVVISVVTSLAYKFGSEVGKVTDTYQGISIYNNGQDSSIEHGISKSKDGYVYGYKWQCVEFVNRFYHDKLGINISGGGNAKDYFDSKINNGELNNTRMLLQFKNGEGDKPKVNDIIVFNIGQYGHLGIVSKVGDDYIEIVQQNVHGKSRDNLYITYKDDKPIIGAGRGVLGWLRKDS